MGSVAAACRFGLGMCPGWMAQGEPSAEAQDSRAGKGLAQGSMWSDWAEPTFFPPGLQSSLPGPSVSLR